MNGQHKLQHTIAIKQSSILC